MNGFPLSPLDRALVVQALDTVLQAGWQNPPPRGRDARDEFHALQRHRADLLLRLRGLPRREADSVAAYAAQFLARTLP